MKISEQIRKIVKGVYAIWYREIKVFLREYSRIISSLFLPLFWFFIFGEGIGPMGVTTVNYNYFIFPGFLAMTVIFISLFNGAYIVWDKKFDFLKGVLISPLSRTTIFVGKVLGGITDAVIQAFILLIVGIFLGVPFTVLSTILSIIMLIALAIGLVSLGLILGSFMESPEGFGLVSSFVVYPLFLLSGALYPLDKLPNWLHFLTSLDPATYAVDGLRNVIIGVSSMPYLSNLIILIGFDIVFVIVGTWAFNRMKL